MSFAILQIPLFCRRAGWLSRIKGFYDPGISFDCNGRGICRFRSIHAPDVMFMLWRVAFGRSALSFCLTAVLELR